jgi:tetratricopeptide (TPR) repeat protein
MQTQRYKEAIEYFERVLEINPNSVWTHNYLSEIYNIYLPDSEKYLIHALSVLQLDMTGTNKSERSNTHLIIANAFAQSGMMDKAKEHIRRSLEYDPDNVFSQYLNIYIDLAIDLDLDRARQRMEGVYSSDTTRLDVLNELASICYKQKDYPASYEFYGRFVRRKEALGFTIFPEQDIEIAFVMRKMGQAERAEEFRDSYEAWLNSNEGVYVPFLESLLHLYDGETEQALDDLDTFVQNGEYMYWFVLMLDGDPLFEGLVNNRRYRSIMQTMADNFKQLREDRIRTLNELNLLD